MSLPPLTVKVTADTSELEGGLAGARAKLLSFAKAGAVVAGAAAATVVTGIVAMTKASMDNIDVLAKQARSLGLTTSAFQKMSLVAEESGVEAGKLSSILGLMQKNIVDLSNGTQAQVDSFGKLGLSLRDLQGLSPDEQFARIASKLDAIADPAEKTSLAMDIFGRSGRDAINMLTGYNEAISNAEEFQVRFGIAVAQDVSDNVERANDAVGRMSIAMGGLGNTLAGVVAPGVEATANGLVLLVGALIGARTRLDEFFPSLEAAQAALGKGVVDAIKDSPVAIQEYEDAIDGVVASQSALTESALQSSNELRRFAVNLEAFEQTGAASAIDAIADEADMLRQRFVDGQITAEEFANKMENIRSRAAAIAADASAADIALDGIDDADFGGVIARLGALGEAMTAALGIALSLRNTMPGAIPVGPSDMEGDARNRRFPGIALPPGAMQAPPSAPAELGIPDITPGVAGGGSVRDKFKERLEALQEGLMSEAEIVGAWYAESQETLVTALENEAITEAQYRDLRERLEQEHQDRISKIRELGNQSAVSMALGAGEEILTAIGQTNEKALRIAKVFGAAQALISAYQGAAKALELPFPKNLVAAAAVLAKGIGFVNAIKGVSKGGASGGASAGGGGGAGAGGGAAPQQNVQTLNFTLTNDSFGIGQNLVRQIAAQLNEAQRNGSTLVRATVS